MERRFLLAVALTLALAPALAQADVSDPSTVRPYWQTLDNCGHHHRSQVAKRKITRLMRAPYVKREAVRHLNRCVATREKRAYLTAVVRQGWVWRGFHRYEIVAARFQLLVNTIPSWGVQKLASIAWCESRNNPGAIGGGGAYRGLYQFSFSTWRVVGGSGDPAAASRAEQTWRAWLLLSKHGSGHWPVCG